ncbi:spore germination protein [Mesobacillus persicus]|uniref:Spore germination protein n=1 Tax=Mesobacillus persicus TaxID=930146 RepID=A0A1H8KU57_9BACI|nr:Ger(x)C family spore germination protein [Mesobacillus persicus]SEN96450.1 spore germination protein [Mesobacillus persicus]
MRIRAFFFTIILCVLLITGCVQKKVIDDINIATGIGVDQAENGLLLGSVMIPEFKPDKSIENFSFTAEGEIMRDVMSQMQQKASQPILAGSLDIALFNEEIARNGIIQILDVFLRDPSVGARVQLAVVDGKAVEVFEGNYGDRGNALYLRELIEHNMKGGNLPVANLHRFLFDFYQKGKDPYLPYLKKQDDDLVSLRGIALFKDEKVVDILHENKMFYFKLLVDRFTMGTIMVKEGHGNATVKSIKSDTDMKLIKRDPYEITINIDVKGILTEHEGIRLAKDEANKIEKLLEKQVNKECQALLTEFQENKIDPIGIGHFVKTKTRQFDFEKWETDFQNATFNVNTNIDIVEVGVVE